MNWNWLSRLLGREKRKSNRHPDPPLIAFYWDGGPSKPHPVPDISREGVFVSTDDHWFPNTMIRLTLQRNSDGAQESQESITVQCRVVRAEADGAGMAILLAKEQNSGTPGLLATRRQWNQFIQRLFADADETPMEATPNLPFQELAPRSDQENPDEPTARDDPKEDK